MHSHIKAIVASMLLAIAMCAHANAQPPLRTAPDGRRLVLTFSDDFNSFRPWGSPGGVWRTTFGDGKDAGINARTLSDNGELEVYADANFFDAKGNFGLNPFEVHDGMLEILARPLPKALLARMSGLTYSSGMISSQPSFSQRYGYFEMRAKIPSGKGLWPAFWLLPADGTWPPEIDVFEAVGDGGDIHSTVHSKLREAVDVESHIAPDRFHTYAVSWDAKHVIFYIDGRKRGEQETPPDMHKPMFLIANLAIGGFWPGSPDATTTFPAKMTIDYIRAYRFAP